MSEPQVWVSPPVSSHAWLTSSLSQVHQQTEWAVSATRAVYWFRPSAHVQSSLESRAARFHTSGCVYLASSRLAKSFPCSHLERDLLLRGVSVLSGLSVRRVHELLETTGVLAGSILLQEEEEAIMFSLLVRRRFLILLNFARLSSPRFTTKKSI